MKAVLTRWRKDKPGGTTVLFMVKIHMPCRWMNHQASISPEQAMNKEPGSPCLLLQATLRSQLRTPTLMLQRGTRTGLQIEELVVPGPERKDFQARNLPLQARAPCWV
jgi:hypothetical protein